MLPRDADPQVREVARRFALVATAGTLATAWGVLPWPEGEAERTAVAMLTAWLRRRPGGAGSGERAAHLDRVRLFLVQHGASRFTVLAQSADGGWEEAHPDRPVVNRAGWRKLRARGGRDEYLIAPEVWRAEVCAPAGLDPAAMARTLAEAGFLRRGEAARLTVKDRVPGLANPGRFYAVSAALLEAPEAPEAGGA
jgi:putative DNA primase/helicase